MKNNQTSLLIFLFLLPSFLLAQVSIKGYVSDTNGNPLPGASVIVKGTAIGTSTDFDGNFKMDLPISAKTLVVSYVGFLNKDVAISTATNYAIQLDSDTNTLEEVVVTGYGSLSKREVTGATVQVKGSEEVLSQYNNVASILQGRAAGVTVQSNMGDPGSAVSVRIRGTNSLRGNNEPLYVVDGILMTSAGEDVLDNTGGNETQALQNGLTGINPRDIKSMTILKDAASTALYGSRGANGVVLITTKKGSQGRANINVFAATTISQVAKKIPVLNGVDYAMMKNELALQAEFAPDYQIVGDEVYQLDGNGEISDKPLKQINWQDDIFQQGFSYNYGATVSGGGEKTNYYMSGDLNQLSGIVPNAFLNSFNFRTNFSANVTNKLKISSNVSFYNSRGSMSQTGAYGGGGFIKNLVKYNPLVDAIIEDDDFDGVISNPRAFLEGYEEKIKEKRAAASIDINYTFSDAFKYQLRAGFNYRNKYRSRWYGPEINKGRDANGVLQLSTLEKMSYTIDNILTYRQNFGRDHRLNTTFVFAYDGSDSYLPTYENSGYPIPVLRDRAPQLGEVVVNPYATVYVKETILSYLARVNYTFKGKYVFNGTIRADQSSKFKGSNKTGYFPSLSVAWRINQENFLKGSNKVNDLKFRASWGQVGNQGIKPYQTYSNFAGGFYVDDQNNNILAALPSNLANENLTWETTTQLNLGLDFSFLSNRLSGSFDVYEKQTDDLLLDLPIGPSTSFPALTVNQGGIENRGMELALNGIIIDKEDFSFSVGGNIAFNKLKITGLGELSKGSIYNYGELMEDIAFYFGRNVSTGGYKQPANIFAEGMPVGAFYGYMTDGIYKTEDEASAGPTWGETETNLAGDVRFVDLNDDGVIDAKDRSIIGDPTPDFTYGINTDFRYKNFYLSALFIGSEGNDILNANLNNEEVIKTSGNNNVRPNVYFDAWSPTNIDGKFPRLNSTSTEYVTSDRILEDGSFMRLSNITVGYDFVFNEKSPIREAKLYMSGNNLFTITDYKGFDVNPTSGMGNGNLIGVDIAGSPNIQSFVLGVNLKF